MSSCEQIHRAMAELNSISDFYESDLQFPLRQFDSKINYLNYSSRTGNIKLGKFYIWRSLSS